MRDQRQIRRYEAGGRQPLLSVAAAIAGALQISLAELAGRPSRRVKLTGQWWATWQTPRDGAEKVAPIRWRSSRKVTCSRSRPSPAG